MGIDNIYVTENANTMTEDFKYITVLNYTSGQVYVYDYNPDVFYGDVETFVSARHYPDEVHYMVHKDKPQLYTKGLSYGG